MGSPFTWLCSFSLAKFGNNLIFFPLWLDLLDSAYVRTWWRGCVAHHKIWHFPRSFEISWRKIVGNSAQENPFYLIHPVLSKTAIWFSSPLLLRGEEAPHLGLASGHSEFSQENFAPVFWSMIQICSKKSQIFVFLRFFTNNILSNNSPNLGFDRTSEVSIWQRSTCVMASTLRLKVCGLWTPVQSVLYVVATDGCSCYRFCTRRVLVVCKTWVICSFIEASCLWFIRRWSMRPSSVVGWARSLLSVVWVSK